MHCLLISQRGTDSYVSNDVQANCAQRIVGQFAKPSEFATALGTDLDRALVRPVSSWLPPGALRASCTPTC